MTDLDRRSRFLRRVEDAAAQYWLMRHWDNDQSLANSSLRTCYAIDADIVVTYSNPALTAQREGNRWGYSEVFRDDPMEYSQALGRRLADFILFELQPSNAPLLVVPPIDSEVVSIVNALSARLGNTPPVPMIDIEALSEWEEEARTTQIRNNPEDAEKLLHTLSGLFNFNTTSDQDRFYKIAFLLGERKIVPTHSIEYRDRIPNDVQNILSSPFSIDTMFELSNSTTKWHQLIMSTSTAPSRKERLAADAEALARLEIWNRQLRHLNWRIIYVTGSRHVIEAIEAQESIDGRNSVLVDVRHPRHFLASPNVVSLEVGENSIARHNANSEFLDLIQTFLSDCRVEPGDRMHLNPIARQAAESAFEDNPGIGDDFELSWNLYLETLELDRPEHTRFKDRFVESVSKSSERELLTTAFDYRAAALRVVDEMLDEAWEQCFRAAVEAGFFIGRRAHRDRSAPGRSVPPIVFDTSWPITSQFIDIMSQRVEPEKIIIDYDVWLDKVGNEVGERAYPYAYYLAHAALFAARGEWRVAAIVARRALQKTISVKNAEKHDLAHGREAAYLAAYCLRHCYRRVSDLDEAESLLRLAREILSDENLHNPEHAILPERFEAEELSLRMTRLLSRWFGGDRETDHDLATDIRLEAIGQFINLHKNTDMSSEKNRILAARIGVNIVMLSSILKVYDDNFSLAGKYLSEFSIDSLYWRAIVLFWQSIRDKNVSLRKVEEVFSDPDLFVVPYDRERFSYLRSEIVRIAGAR